MAGLRYIRNHLCTAQLQQVLLLLRKTDNEPASFMQELAKNFVVVRPGVQGGDEVQLRHPDSISEAVECEDAARYGGFKRDECTTGSESV